MQKCTEAKNKHITEHQELTKQLRSCRKVLLQDNVLMMPIQPGSEQEIVHKFLQDQIALYPDLFSTISALAELDDGFVAVRHMTNMTDKAIEFSSLVNAHSCAMSIDEFKMHYEDNLAAVRRKRERSLAKEALAQEAAQPIDIFDRPVSVYDQTHIPMSPTGNLATNEEVFATKRALEHLDQDVIMREPPCTPPPFSIFDREESTTVAETTAHGPQVTQEQIQFVMDFFRANSTSVPITLEESKQTNPAQTPPPQPAPDGFYWANSKSEKVLPRESSETHSVDQNESSRSERRQRSSEKRNYQLSKSHLNHILETQRLEKRLTCLRQAQRRNKLTRWEGEHPSKPVVSHNLRRLEKFLEQKRGTELKANGLIRKLLVCCCAKRDSPTFLFLTEKCKLDDLVAMALAPIIDSLKKILTNKITIGLALCILAYYLAKHVSIPVSIFGPILALILGYLAVDMSADVVAAVLSLYTIISYSFRKARDIVVHSTDVVITEKDFKYLHREMVDQAIILTCEEGDWKQKFITYLKYNVANPEARRIPFKVAVTKNLYDFLIEVDATKLNLEFLEDLRFKANGLPETVQNITDSIKDLLASVGIIAKTVTMPSTFHFYTSAKKFVGEVYRIFQTLYPYIYEFVTGKTYVDPTIAKYLLIVAEVSKDCHETLRNARESNRLNEDKQFRVRIIVQYEKLLEAEMKLLEMKAPPIYTAPLTRLIREMSTIANQCYSRYRGEANRDEPVLIFVRGPPGVGKTTLDHALALIIAERLNVKIDVRTDFFQREAGVEHWDGYENQMFVTFDDAFQLTDPEKQAQTILEIIKAKNTFPYKLTMAQLEAKKNSFFNSKFIFISTNVENVVCDQVADIGAFFRRIDFDVRVSNKPLPNADGTPNFDYKMTVNGHPCGVSQLADSIVSVYRQRAVHDQNIAQCILKYAKSVPPTPAASLIEPRNSTRDFHNKDHSLYKANGLTSPESEDEARYKANDKLYRDMEETLKRANEKTHGVTFGAIWERIVSPWYQWTWNGIAYNKPYLESLKLHSYYIGLARTALDFGKWLAVAAVTYVAVRTITHLFKYFTSNLFANSKKTKDQLVGDKKTQVQTSTTVRDQLKAAQAEIDKKAVKVTTKKANSSSVRWSQAMIAYIKSQGWQNEQWVADSLASIDLLEEFDCTTQERADLDKLRSNVVEIYTYYKYNGELFKLYGKALILNQDHLVTVSHQVPATCEIVDLEISIQGKVVNIKNCTIDRIENADTCIIKLSTILPHRDISYMFLPISDVTSNEDQVYLLRNFDEVMTICPVTDFKPLDRAISYRTDYNVLVNCGSVFECKVAVCPGDSGCFYVVRRGGRFQIIGMHVSSGFSAAQARFISREMLKEYLPAPRRSNTPYDFVKSAVQENSRSFDHQIACNSACVPVGIMEPRTIIASHSKIQRSLLYKDENLPPPSEFPAQLKRTFDSEDPLLKANTKFRLRSEPDIETSLKNEILHALLDEHPNTSVKTFYSNLEAFEGTAEMPHLNMTSSSGYPESAQGKTPKSKLNDEDWKRIVKETDDLLEDLYNGIAPQTVFQTSFKDETREALKVLKPRVINCASTKLTLLFRRVLGPWMNMVHRNHNRLSTKVGINAHGDDWRILFDKLCHISPDNIVELDYSGYEYNHPQVGFQIAADFIFALYLRSGFTLRDASAARLLIRSCCGGFVIQNDILVYVWMLLSGLPITAELNSLLNEIYQMICFKKLTNKPLIEMRQLVVSAFYGDDLLHSVAPEIAELFNALTIQKFCRDFLSMEVTPATNKSGLMSKFVGILECSFLCRKFAPRENRVDAPLKIEVSTNSLQYYIPVSHMTQRELLSAKCRSFLYELTHYPPEIFDYWARVLAGFKSKFDLDFICYDYPAALARRVVLTETF